MKAKSLCYALAITLVAGCVSDTEDLAVQSKVSKEDATKTALSRVPNGTVTESELEKEHGKLIWSFDIATPGSKDITEVAVDAINGKIVSVATETPEEQAKEKVADTEKPNKK